jgi:RNA 3'-terminal phosphate cyclase (ATP)
MNGTIEIDGSYGEGGGQVVRTALTLSVLTGTPVSVAKIRAGRRKPGLAPQHLTTVRALSEICDAEVSGASIGSTALSFAPRVPPRAGSFAFDVSETAGGGSAGSVTLILQALLLPLSFARASSRLTLVGGTHVAWSPPFDFISDVYLPTVREMGIRAQCRLVAWGFYPVGGGRLGVEIEPAERLSAIALSERGEPERVRGRAVACNLPSHIAVRMANRACALLAPLDIPRAVATERPRGKGPGAGIFLTAEYAHARAGFSALGERGKPSEAVAEEACRSLLAHDETGAPVTAQLADQLLLPCALAHGRSEFRVSRITPHLLTNAHVIGRFGLPARIDIRGEEGEPGEVIVEGAGFEAPAGQ